MVSAGNYGVTQIKLQTTRSMGYTGNAAGLLDANTNMTYAVKNLAGAYRLANGNHSRAVHYYAAGGQGQRRVRQFTRAERYICPATKPQHQIQFEIGRQTDGFGSSSNFYPRPDSIS